MMPTVSPDTISPMISVRKLYDFIIPMQGKSVSKKFLRHGPETAHFDAFFLSLSFKVGDGRFPGE